MGSVAAWAENVPAASSTAASWIQRAADARGWDSSARAAALTAVQKALITPERTDDPHVYFTRLRARWRAARPDPAPAGWDKLGQTWASAIGAVETFEKGEDMGSPLEIVKGTIEGAAGDVVAGAQAMRKWGPWMIGLLVIVVVAVLAWKWS